MLRALADDFWEDYLRSHPVAATLMGHRGQDGRMPDVTPEGRGALRDRLLAFRDRAAELAPADLAEPDRVNVAHEGDVLLAVQLVLPHPHPFLED